MKNTSFRLVGLATVALGVLALTLAGCNNGGGDEKPMLGKGEIYAPRPNNNEKAKSAPAARANRGARGDSGD